MIAHSRSWGWRKEPVDHSERLAAPRLSALPRLDEQLAMLELIDHIRDQGSTGSCTGHSVAYAMEVRRALDGLPRVRVSPAGLYWQGRAYDGFADTDEGAYNRSVVRAAVVVGAPLEDAWPLDVARINERPDEQAEVAGYALAGGITERVTGGGDVRAEIALDAIQLLRPIVIGIEATDAYQRCRDDRTVPAPRADEFHGRGHSITILGYRNGGRDVASVSSWSKGHGADGIVWLDRGWLSSPLSSDFHSFREAA